MPRRSWRCATEAQAVVARLFAAYRDDPRATPAGMAARPRPTRSRRSARIGDFIAGMTDRYAIRQYRELVGPVELPEGF